AEPARMANGVAVPRETVVVAAAAVWARRVIIMIASPRTTERESVLCMLQTLFRVSQLTSPSDKHPALPPRRCALQRLTERGQRSETALISSGGPRCPQPSPAHGGARPALRARWDSNPRHED